MSQRIPPLGVTTEDSPSRVEASEAAFGVLRSPVSAFVLSLLAGLATPLAAQSPGTVQVAAQVLLIEPSEGALVMGIGAIRSGHIEETGALAAISVTPSTDQPAGLDARRPGPVLTIAFVRN